MSAAPTKASKVASDRDPRRLDSHLVPVGVVLDRIRLAWKRRVEPQAPDGQPQDACPSEPLDGFDEPRVELLGRITPPSVEAFERGMPHFFLDIRRTARRCAATGSSASHAAGVRPRRLLLVQRRNSSFDEARSNVKGRSIRYRRDQAAGLVLRQCPGARRPEKDAESPRNRTPEGLGVMTRRQVVAEKRCVSMFEP